jgi:hypothetical protein
MSLGDHLLEAVSAKQSLTWSEFKSIVDTLFSGKQFQTKEWGYIRHRMLRILSCLGHCDFTFGDRGGIIYAGPSALVRMPTNGKVTALLTGSRAPDTFDRLVQKASSFPELVIQAEEQTGTFGIFSPARICVEAHSEADIQQFAARESLYFELVPGAWRLAQGAVDLDCYLASISWTQGTELNWRRTDFDPEFCRFREPTSGNDSLKLTRYIDPIRNTFRYWLWKEGHWAAVDQDWGRYAVLRQSAFDVLFYDSRLKLMLVPSTCPVPELFERVLGLCSGLAPYSISSGRKSSAARSYDAFRRVPHCIAELISTKLGQNLSQCNLDPALAESC